MLFDSGLFFWATLYILRRNHALYIVHVCRNLGRTVVAVMWNMLCKYFSIVVSLHEIADIRYYVCVWL